VIISPVAAACAAIVIEQHHATGADQLNPCSVAKRRVLLW
jgi:hypothetical protein